MLLIHAIGYMLLYALRLCSPIGHLPYALPLKERLLLLRLGELTFKLLNPLLQTPVFQSEDIEPIK
jgi:hypothetical protein